MHLFCPHTAALVVTLIAALIWAPWRNFRGE